MTLPEFIGGIAFAAVGLFFINLGLKVLFGSRSAYERAHDYSRGLRETMRGKGQEMPRNEASQRYKRGLAVDLRTGRLVTGAQLSGHEVNRITH